ncbi:hypothetical protein [Streptomyces sp. NPDC047928]|uniref:hypothetical protein n=1 Tax=unclassified Streptomyces TaxID=2593676 RepID=UPI00371346BC
MRGDETRPETAEDEPAPVRRGPRHAAPRKSLLTRLHAPAGKAIALAAMPTAVLVGLGLTPRLAIADDKDIPFAPGPCVTRSDEPDASASPTPSQTPSAKPSPSATAPAGQDGDQGDDGKGDDGKGDGGEPDPSASPSAGETAGTSPVPNTGTKPGPTATPTPTPTPTATRNPLDPLGVGDTIKDFFDGLGGKEAAAEPAAGSTAADEPAPQPSAPSPEPTTDPTVEPDTDPVTRPVTKPVGDAADRTKEAIQEAADKAGATVRELPEDVKGLDPKKDEDIPDGAKPRFPCPTADPEALAAADQEPGLPRLPDEPWRLESTMLTLRGLKYHGIVEVTTGSGATKKVLKFTASEVDIKDLHQLTVHSPGRTGHVTSRPGSTSTIRGGTVTMYTEELKGNLFGIIPITFSPATPPPLDVPFAFFTNVKVTQAGQFGGDLTVPGLRNFIES